MFEEKVFHSFYAGQGVVIFIPQYRSRNGYHGNVDIHFTLSRIVIRVHKSARCLLEDPHGAQPRRITFKNTMESVECFCEMLNRYQRVLNDMFLIVILL